MYQRVMPTNKPPADRPAPARSGDRIAKLLARAGVASRREIERMIADGRVAIDGKAVDTPATVLTSLRGVTVDGNPVQAPAPARLFLYHKPSGLLVTERDPAGRPTIYDRLPADLPRLVPVGRLDLNTEGLLLLTTDGELKRQLELPATGVERAYRARAYGTVTQAQLEELIHGVEIEGVRYGSINANLERRTGANVWIEMILTEGKNREVRRVLEYLGLKVSRLIRTRYGPFVLGELAPGEVGEVRQHDVVAFRRDPTRNPPPEGTAPTASRSRSERRATPARPERAQAKSREAAAKPPAAKPKRFYEAREKGGVRKEATGSTGKPANARTRRTASDPRRQDGALVDKPRGPLRAKGPAAGRGKPAAPSGGRGGARPAPRGKRS